MKTEAECVMKSVSDRPKAANEVSTCKQAKELNASSHIGSECRESFRTHYIQGSKTEAIENMGYR